MRRTNYQPDIMLSVPFYRGLHHALVERLAAMWFAGDLQTLKILRACIRRQREQEHAFALVAQERLDGIVAHVGVDGYRVEATLAEQRAGVLLGGIADVAALPVADGDYAARDMRQSFLDHAPTLVAECFVEREVELVGADEVVRRINDAAVEGQHSSRRAAEMARQLRRVGIQSDAEEGAGFLLCSSKALLKGHIIRTFYLENETSVTSVVAIPSVVRELNSRTGSTSAIGIPLGDSSTVEERRTLHVMDST